MESTEDIKFCVWECHRRSINSSFSKEVTWYTSCGQVNPTLHNINGNTCMFCGGLIQVCPFEGPFEQNEDEN